MNQAKTIRLFSTDQHPCSYLSDELAQTQFVDPKLDFDRSIYHNLNLQGFRRSGKHLYRPNCAKCQACQSLRVQVQKFQPTRSQKRCWRINQDLELSISSNQNADHDRYYELFAAYVNGRHGTGDMSPASRDQYDSFIADCPACSSFIEFNLDQELIMVAQIDLLADGYSAIYTFYHPNYTKRGLGTYAILREIEHVRTLGLPYLYLGYWIKEAPSMNYKSRFKPHEIYSNGYWQGL